MAVNHGSRRVVTGARYGLRDWLSQRVTAVVVGLWLLLVVVQVLVGGPMGYDAWSAIFARQWMKVATFVAFVALAWHAWVGMRDVWMDYVKPVGLRLGAQVATIAWLVGCLGWAIQVLWRI